MLARSLGIFLAIIKFCGALAGQVPTINGVIGGAPEVATQTRAAKRPTVGSNVVEAALRVTENSGVCESPDVYQASGYGDISANESVW